MMLFTVEWYCGIIHCQWNLANDVLYYQQQETSQLQNNAKNKYSANIHFWVQTSSKQYTRTHYVENLQVASKIT